MPFVVRMWGDHLYGVGAVTLNLTGYEEPSN
jgi:hypothetical protein